VSTEPGHRHEHLLRTANSANLSQNQPVLPERQTDHPYPTIDNPTLAEVGLAQKSRRSGHRNYPESRVNPCSDRVAGKRLRSWWGISSECWLHVPDTLAHAESRTLRSAR
jgi:hypothetical protein